MTHQRQTIRTALAALLQTAGITGVHSQRGRRYDVLDLPAINIFSGGETAQRRDLSSGILRRDLPLTMELTVEDKDELNLDDELDDLAQAIEAAITADPSLGGAVVDIVLAQTTEVQKDVDGETNVGRRSMTYNAIYFA